MGVCVFQVGIVSYGETVTHRVNLSQFDNTQDLLKFVDDLPQHTGLNTMTFLGIDTARYSTLVCLFQQWDTFPLSHYGLAKCNKHLNGAVSFHDYQQYSQKSKLVSF